MGELLTTGKLSELACLTLYLMYEKKQGRGSPWAPLIRELDRTRGRGQQGARTPLLWAPGQAERLLAGSPVLGELRTRLKVRLHPGCRLLTEPGADWETWQHVTSTDSGGKATKKCCTQIVHSLLPLASSACLMITISKHKTGQASARYETGTLAGRCSCSA